MIETRNCSSQSMRQIAWVLAVFALSTPGLPLLAQEVDGAGIAGMSIFRARCAVCHGEKGDATSVASDIVHPRPRDLTEGKFKFRTTESGSIPTDEDISRTIREGLHGTAMPDWKEFIGGDSLTAIVAYVKSLSPRFAKELPKPIRLTPPIPSSASSIETGRKIFAKLQCGSCHGSDGSGRDAVAHDLVDDRGDPIAPTNLREPWTFRRGPTAQDIYLSVRTGIDGTPMPSYVGSATEQEFWHLANYVLTLARKPVWQMNADEVKAFYREQEGSWRNNKIAYGRALVETRGCITCHSTYSEQGTMLPGMQLAGGLKWSLGPFGDVTSPNLTSDTATGLGSWTDEEIKRGITRGIRKDGSRSIPYPMPWTAYANLSEEDLDAMITYLRSLPAVVNKVPPPEPLNFFSYLWAKFKMLVLKEDEGSFTHPGNAGRTKEALR